MGGWRELWMNREKYEQEEKCVWVERNTGEQENKVGKKYG